MSEGAESGGSGGTSENDLLKEQNDPSIKSYSQSESKQKTFINPKIFNSLKINNPKSPSIPENLSMLPRKS